MEKKKRGRPTDNPKPISIHIRLDSACEQILTTYCQKHMVGRAEAIRRAIILLEGK